MQRKNPQQLATTIQNRRLWFGKPAHLPITAQGSGEPGSLWMTRLLGTIIQNDWEEKRGGVRVKSTPLYRTCLSADLIPDLTSLRQLCPNPQQLTPSPQCTQRHLSPGKNTAQQSSFIQLVNKCHSRLGPAAVVFPFGQPSSIQEVVCNKRW